MANQGNVISFQRDFCKTFAAEDKVSLRACFLTTFSMTFSPFKLEHLALSLSFSAINPEIGVLVTLTMSLKFELISELRHSDSTFSFGQCSDGTIACTTPKQVEIEVLTIDYAI